MSALTAYDAARTVGPMLVPLVKRYARDYIRQNAAGGIRALGKYAYEKINSRRNYGNAMTANPLGGGRKGKDAVLKPDRGNGKKITGLKRKRATKGPVTVKKLSKTVKNLAKKVEGQTSSIRYQFFDAGQTTSNINSVGWTAIDLLNTSRFEEVLSKIPYLNTAAVGTATAADMTLQVQPAHFHFSTWAQVVIRNNWYMPTNCRAYICTPKVATSVSPTTALGYISKQAIAGGFTPAYTEMGAYPWNVPDFMDTYKIIETKEFQVNAGDEFIYTMSKPIVYDQEMFDNHANTYLPGINFFLLLRQEGVVCHDSSTTTLVGISSTKVDYVKHISMGVKYASQQAGAFWNVANSLDAVSTSAITGTSADLETQ